VSDRAKAHEQMLASILCGEVDPASDEARRCLDEVGLEPALLEELLRVGRNLDAAGRFEREILAAALGEDAEGLGTEGLGQDAARERVAEVLRRLQRESGIPASVSPSPLAPTGRNEPARPSRIVWIGLAAAAALLLVVPFLFQQRGLFPEGATGDPTSDRPQAVLGNGIEGLWPSGEVTSFGAFRWKRELPAGGWFEVNVYKAGRMGQDEPLLRSGEIFAAEWKPEASALLLLPPEIDWEVLVYDAGRMPVARATTAATLSGD
jgi:hypothetical protein